VRGEAELTGAADDGGGRGVHFEAAARAAGAGRTVGNDGAVAGFSGSTLHAVPDAALEDDAATDAGAEGEDEERVDGERAAGAEEEFAISGEVGVGVDLNRSIEAAFELGAEVEPVEAGKIRWMVENAEGQLEGAGAADADAEEFAGLLVDELADGSGHVIEDGVRAGGKAGGKADGFEAFARGSDGGDAEVGATEIDTDGEGIHGGRRVHDTRRGLEAKFRWAARQPRGLGKSHMMDPAMLNAAGHTGPV